jgi:hypothetical protein
VEGIGCWRVYLHEIGERCLAFCEWFGIQKVDYQIAILYTHHDASQLWCCDYDKDSACVVGVGVECKVKAKTKLVSVAPGSNCVPKQRSAPCNFTLRQARPSLLPRLFLVPTRNTCRISEHLEDAQKEAAARLAALALNPTLLRGSAWR